MLYVAKSCCEHRGPLTRVCLCNVLTGPIKAAATALFPSGINTDVCGFLTVLISGEHVVYSRHEHAAVLGPDPYPTLPIGWATPDVPTCQATFMTLPVLT